MSFPTIPLNKLWVEQDDFQPGDADPALRTQPSGQLNISAPEQLPQQEDSKSAETAMKPADFKAETSIPAQQTRSDEKQQAQKEGEREATVNVKGKRMPVTEVDEHGRPLWVGGQNDGEELIPIYMTAGQLQRGIGGAVGKTIAKVGADAAETTAEVLGPPLNAAKQELADVLPDNPLKGITAGAVQQVNTMLIILALAYVAGQAVGSK